MLKKTKTRDKVREILKTANTPLTANDIYEYLKDENITLSSIYRTLDTFTKEKIIIKDTNNQATAIYTIANDTHSHFLECKHCHEKIKLDYCPYHKVNKQIQKNTEFTVDEHNVVLYGICKNCKK